MGSCQSSAANEILDDKDDPLKSSLRGNRERSLHDHLVSERSVDSVDDAYDLLGVLQQGSYSQIIKISAKKYFKSKEGEHTYILKMHDPSSVNYNNKKKNENQEEVINRTTKSKQILHGNSFDALKREAAILTECDHPNIVKIYEFNKDRKRKTVSLVLEYCHGGTVASRLPYNDEKQVARILRQVLEALAYLHHKKIVHRDINMSNILFETNHADSNVKLIDFSCSTVFTILPSGKYVFMKDRVGTLETMAPDVIKAKYSPKADIWSVGVVAYQLLNNGQAPFHGDTPKEVEEQILRGFVSYQSWQASKPALDLVKKCLALNPGYRPSAVEALQHDFIEKSKPPLLIPNNLVVSFQLYRQCSPLKRAAWNVLARRLPPSDIAFMRQLFSALDVSRKGTLSRDEFLNGFMRCGFDKEELIALFEALDINGNDEILFTEFLAASLETHVKHWDEGQLSEAFDLLDEDHSGLISRRNLTKVLGNSAKVRNLLINFNTDVSFEEFKELFHNTSTAYHNSGTLETLLETSLSSEQLEFLHDQVKEIENEQQLQVEQQQQQGEKQPEVEVR